jgi:hypothetical protein
MAGFIQAVRTHDLTKVNAFGAQARFQGLWTVGRERPVARFNRSGA